MNDKREIIITELEYGQRRKYDDFHKKYNIKSNYFISEDFVRKIGQLLSPKELEYKEWNENEIKHPSSASIHFSGYYKITKISDNEYTYYTNDPNCD